MLTLYQRLTLSHLVAVALTGIVMGILLIFTLEREVVLANLTRSLTRQAALLAESAADSPSIWQDATQAQAFTDRFGRQLAAELILLDSAGRILATSDPAAALGQLLQQPGLTSALAGNLEVYTHYSQAHQSVVAHILYPVRDADEALIGIVHLTQASSTIQERFQQLRPTILQALAVALLLGSGAGLTLAVALERPLTRLTHSLYRLAHGQQLEPAPEQGPAELRRLAHAFNTLVERLQILRAGRRQLLANLVHEIGRPLGALHSANQALLDGAAEEALLRQELLTGMDKELRRLQRLLDDLARFYDEALATQALDLHPVALHDWLQAVLIPWREAARQKGLSWHVDITTPLPTIPIDSDRLGQALGNLLSNALKYTPPGGRILVEAGATNGQAWICVADNGPGIPPEEQPHIFEPFYRGRHHQQRPPGMGLGLAITRDLIHAHGGRLDLQSVPAQGARFTLWLPGSQSRVY